MFSKHEAIICGKGRVRQSFNTFAQRQKIQTSIYDCATITEAAAFKAIHANANI